VGEAVGRARGVAEARAAARRPRAFTGTAAPGTLTANDERSTKGGSVAYGLLLLRVVVGGTMFAHGAQKLFGWFGGHGPRGTGGFFGQLGYRAPFLMAIVAGLSEASGALFAAGVVTPLASLAITVVMLNAIGTVHLKNGFFNGDGGIEFPLTLATVAVAVAATGPGRFSIDRAIGWDDNISGVWWGVGAVVAGFAITLVTQTVGRRRATLTEAAAT
jgi:putative oxidoreductase